MAKLRSCDSDMSTVYLLVLQTMLVGLRRRRLGESLRCSHIPQEGLHRRVHAPGLDVSEGNLAAFAAQAFQRGNELTRFDGKGLDRRLGFTTCRRRHSGRDTFVELAELEVAWRARQTCTVRR